MAIVRVDPSREPVDHTAEGFDIIGDVHGCHSQLIDLLHALGYRNDDGYFRHPTRSAIFVGDLIDRGPEQVEVLHTVRAMHTAGTAVVVMGNHEFNAVCWATPTGNGEHLRRHTDKNFNQHRAFLEQAGEGSSFYTGVIEWFRSFPLWFDNGDLRVIHACWDPIAIAGVGSKTLEQPDFVAASERDSDMYRWVEHLCKGPEIELPDDITFEDKDGHVRRKARYRWWSKTDGSGNDLTYRAMCEVPGHVSLPDTWISHPPVPAYTDDTPVIFGHYWRRWPAVDLHETAACIDFSAVKGGPLVAYRWSGETELDQHNLVGTAR